MFGWNQENNVAKTDKLAEFSLGLVPVDKVHKFKEKENTNTEKFMQKKKHYA